MTNDLPLSITFEVLATDIASLADVSKNALTPDSKLVDDVGLDSLGLHELVVVLLHDRGVTLPVQFDHHNWGTITVQELVDVINQQQAAR